MFMRNEKAFDAARTARLLAELDAAHEAAAVTGLAAGTLVETDAGWIAVERVAAGMRVATWDGGFQPVLRAECRHLWPTGDRARVLVPGGALGNCSDLALAAGQLVLIETPVAEAVLGSAAVLVRARMLDGFRGVTRRHVPQPLALHRLTFGQDEAIYVNTGTIVHCEGILRPAEGEEFFPVLDDAQARALLELVASGDRRSDDLFPRLPLAA